MGFYIKAWVSPWSRPTGNLGTLDCFFGLCWPLGQGLEPFIVNPLCHIRVCSTSSDTVLPAVIVQATEAGVRMQA